MEKPVLWMVIPCYNEEEVLPETSKRLKDILAGMVAENKISPDSRIAFVDDGSKDRTWELIEDLYETDFVYCGVKLSRNRGHQNALLAGLMTAKDCCDIAISMDADLQDDVNAIPKMVDEYLGGADIVYGVRCDRSTDTAFKRGSAHAFYRTMQRLGVETIPDHADFRLMDARALEALSEYGEVNLFLRGIVPTLGFKCAKVEYQRGERFAGESKYPLKKMLALAADGITSFSIKPIRFSLALGAAAMLAGFVMFIVCLCTLPAPAALWISAAVWFVGGMQLAMLGVVGEYVGKAYMETKRRPRYILDKVLVRHTEL
jgi:glycosyltransferase involved in cell wall biosynthesis